jgi:hypothetical protein
MALKPPLVALLLLSFAGTAPGQTKDSPAQPSEVFGGFSYLFRNYTRGFTSGGMPGWQASLELPQSLGIPHAGLAIDAGGNYQGNEFGANYDLHFLTAGPRFSKRAGRQTLFGKATVGFAHLNGATGPALNVPNPTIPRLASNYTLAITAGGGLDLRLSARIRWRVEADYVYTNFTSADDQIHNIADSNARVVTGPVFRF